MTDKELLKMFGLYDRSVSLTLEEDIMKPADKFYQDHLEHEQKKKEFLSLFKECFDDLCIFMEKDPKKRVPVSCFFCQKGMDVAKQYGKPKSKK